MSAHNAPYKMAQGPIDKIDPGNGGTITINDYGGIVELVSVGADETRTLAAPGKAGILATVRMKTDGGDIVMTVTNGVNVAGNTACTFDAVGEQLFMISVSHTTGFRWEIITNTGTVGLA